MQVSDLGTPAPAVLAPQPAASRGGRRFWSIGVGIAPLVGLLVWAVAASRRPNETPWSPLVAFGVALALTVLLLPPFIGALRRFSVIDTPNARSSHTVATVRGGGYVIVVVVCALFAGGAVGTRPAFLAVCVALAVVGFTDDLQPMPAVVRLAVQLLSGAVLAPLLLDKVDRDGLVMWALVIGIAVWLVGFVNAFNFMDGINGISAGQVMTAGIFWWWLYRDAGAGDLEVAAAVLTASGLGFLPFNFPRARVFLGDAGSYFLGAALAAIAATAVLGGLDPVAVIAPLTLYVADVGVTLIRRFRRGEPLLQAHRSHTYQLLCRQGWSHAQTTGAFTAINAGICAAAMLTRSLPLAGRVAGVVLMATGVTLYLALPTVLRLRGHQIADDPAARPSITTESVFVRPGNKVLPRWLPANAPVLVGIDFAAWLGGMFAAVFVVRGAGATTSAADLFRVLPIALTAQLIMGIAVGMYRWRWRVGSFGEMGGIALVVALGTAFTVPIEASVESSDLPWPFMIMSALGAIPLMAAPRAAWRLIRDRAPRDHNGGERVLVYGAGRGAALTIPALRDPLSTLVPVGIIDDDPAKRFRSLNGVRVVANGDGLARAAADLRATGVVIAIPSASPAVVAHLATEIRRAGLRAYTVPRPGDLQAVGDPVVP